MTGEEKKRTRKGEEGEKRGEGRTETFLRPLT